MPSPFHQKYSSQTHKVFGDNTTPAMPEGPKQDADRRASDSSIGSGPSSPTERRRVQRHALCLLPLIPLVFRNEPIRKSRSPQEAHR